MATTKALELAQLADGIDVNANGEITNIGTLSSLDISGDISTSTLSASANVAIADDAVINIGSGNDLRLYHRSSDGHSFIDEVGSGSLYIRAEDRINFRNRDGSVTTANLIASGGVELYYAGDKKFETSNTGISVVGDVNANTLTTSGNASVGNDLTVGGNFTVSGNTTFVNTDNLEIEDLNITLASGAANSDVADGSGITIDGANAQLTYVSASDRWVLNKSLELTTATPLTLSGVAQPRIDFKNTTTTDGSTNADWWNLTNESNVNRIGFRRYGVGTPVFAMEDLAPASSLWIQGTTGNIGVGTDNPTVTLHAVSSATSVARFQGINEGNLYITNDADYLMTLQASTSSGISFNTSGPNEVMRLTPGGNIGVNATDPQGAIHVRRTGTATLVLEGDISNSGDAGERDVEIFMLNDGGAGNDPFGGTAYGAHGYRLSTRNYPGKTSFEVEEWHSADGYLSRIHIDEDGLVGIGTREPTTKLEVNGDVRFQSDSTSGGLKNYFANSGTGGQDYWIMSTNNNNGSLLGGKFAIGTNSIVGNNAEQTRFVIDSNGNTGIGLSAPSHKLDVEGDINAQGEFRTNDSRHSVRPSLLLDFVNSKRIHKDIEFSRSTTATYYDGKTKTKAEENLLKYSQDFDNSYWTLSRLSVSANSTTAPDATTTADTVTEIASITDNKFVRMTDSFPAGTYTYSIYAKIASGSRYCGLRVLGIGDNEAWVSYDLINGVVYSTVGGDVDGSSISAVGNGWYRLTMTATHAQTTQGLLFGISDDGSEIPDYTGDGTSGFHIWGAQLERRNIATTYLKTEAQPITTYQPTLLTASANVPRFDHDPATGDCKGLLIEESRVNYVDAPANSDFDLSSGLPGTGLKTEKIIAPDGGNAVAIYGNGNSSQHYTNVAIASNTSGTTYTLSIFLKKLGEEDTISFVAQTSQWGSVAAEYNFSTDSWTGIVNTSNHQSQDVGNGWVRVSFTFTASATGSNGDIYISLENLGVNTKGYQHRVGIFGAQIEIGSFVTSYIRTAGSSVNRAPDFAKVTNWANYFNTNEGTFFTEQETPIVDPDVGTRYFLQVDGSSILVLYKNNNQNAVNTFDGSSSLSRTPNYPGLNKMTMGYSYSNQDKSVSANGSTSSNSLNGLNWRNWAENNSLVFGQQVNNHAWIKKIAYYPVRLTNAEQTALTEE